MCSSQQQASGNPSVSGEGERKAQPFSSSSSSSEAPQPQDEEIQIGLPTGSAGEILTGPSSTTRTSSLGGLKSSTPRTRAKLIIDGAYLEASIKVAGEGRNGRVDHLVLLSLLEDKLEVQFEKKVLYQATPDGQPNHFHRSISHPDGAHVKVVLQPLKARIVTVDIGGMKQSQEILLDKGVDLALALEILEPFDGVSSSPILRKGQQGSSSLAAASATGLVIITGDGDLQSVIERAERLGHIIAVCGGHKTLSERLHQYVRKGSGQAVWLDDLIEQAWITPRPAAPSASAGVAASSAASMAPVMLGGPAAAAGAGSRSLGGGVGGGGGSGIPEPLNIAALKHAAGQHPLGTGAAAMHIPVMGAPAAAVHGMGVPPMPPMPGLSPKQKLYRCPQGRFCDKLDEPGHLRALRHPCPKGHTCPYAIGRMPNDADRRDHMLSFVHICPKGTTCPRNDIEHCTHFDHPYRRTKARCPDGGNCPYITRGAGSSNSSAREHSRMYRHPCPKGSTCPLLAGKQPSEKKRYHLMDYTHPCHVSCKYSVDKEWAWQHFSDFDHVEDHPGADSRSNTASDDDSVDHVILEGGWNYLDEASTAAGAGGGAGGGASGGGSASSSFLSSSSLEGPPLGSSLFSQDFFKPFPSGLSDMGSMASALHQLPGAGGGSIGGAHGGQYSHHPPGMGAASGAGAASPMRDLHHHHHRHPSPHHHPQHLHRQEKGPPSPHSPWWHG